MQDVCNITKGNGKRQDVNDIGGMLGLPAGQRGVEPFSD
jgi:hypothetical protein